MLNLYEQKLNKPAKEYDMFNILLYLSFYVSMRYGVMKTNLGYYTHGIFLQKRFKHLS